MFLVTFFVTSARGLTEAISLTTTSTGPLSLGIRQARAVFPSLFLHLLPHPVGFFLPNPVVRAGRVRPLPNTLRVTVFPNAWPSTPLFDGIISAYTEVRPRGALSHFGAVIGATKCRAPMTVKIPSGFEDLFNRVQHKGRPTLNFIVQRRGCF